jgi:NAD(P)-dependent dehydrogenase (short-subunit alcohol dehydrogenase family)
MQTIDLSGRVALVTGATRGLGRAIAFALALHGADIVISSRKAAACREVAAEVAASTGRQALGYACNVGEWETLEGLVDAAYERFGRVDVLVNNAGMSPLYDSVEKVDQELWDKVLAVNLKGPFRLTALVGTRMRAAGQGSIINISSIASMRPLPEYLPYAAAKAGLNALTLGFAQALGPEVRVNAIVCGAFRTDVTRYWDMAQTAERLRETTALKRIAESDEVVGSLLYFASDLSTYTTGALLRVDGGRQ